MYWSASQFDGAWDETYALCDQDTQDLLDRRLDFLREHGNQSGRPVSAHLGDGIFELRAKDARMLFYFGEKREVIFVHSLVKKTRRVPREDIQLAKKRRTWIQTMGAKINALPN